MADTEIVKLTNAVEQLCADCASDVDKINDKWQDALIARARTLANEIVKIPVPAKSAPSELEKIPDQIHNIVLQKGSNDSHLIKLWVRVKLDTRTRTMTVRDIGVTRQGG